MRLLRTLPAVVIAVLPVACGGGTAVQSEAPTPGGDAPIKPTVVLSAGAFHTCGLDEDGALACWGDPSDLGPGVALPTGRYAALSLARAHVCTLDADGHVDCAWIVESQNTRPPIEAFPGKYLELASARWETCGLRDDGHIVCLDDSAAISDQLPQIEFSHIAMGDGLCGIEKSGQTSCWLDRSGPPTFTFKAKVESIHGGWFEVCALAKDGSAHCVDLSVGTDEVHDGPFTSVGGGEGFGCGLDVAGVIQCWGATVPPPTGHFEVLSVGMTHACAFSRDEGLECWIAKDGQRGPGEPPEGFP